MKLQNFDDTKSPRENFDIAMKNIRMLLRNMVDMQKEISTLEKASNDHETRLDGLFQRN